MEHDPLRRLRRGRRRKDRRRLNLPIFRGLHLEPLEDRLAPAVLAASATTDEDTVAPTVSITSPTAAAAVSHVVVIAATAADDVGVASVEFLVDGNSVGTDTAAPYLFNWNSTTWTNGSHSLTAVARDAADNETTSAPVAVTTTNPVFINEPVVPNIALATTIAFLPDGRMVIGELPKKFWIVQPGANQPDPTPALELGTDYLFGEQGLFDIAIDPDFANNGYIYAYYTQGNAGQHNRDRLSRFTLVGNTISPASELVLWEDDVDANDYHHGGAIAFSNDGHLFFTNGDHFDYITAQDLTSYSGKLFRINKDGTIPTDNPFYDGAGPNKDEIWAYGLRNPYRMSIDPVTDVIYIGDVGGNDPNSAWEEVNVGARGANYGWPIEEGNGGTPGMTQPIYTYPHLGRDACVTGGFVYRGTQFPSEYYGSYFVGDYAQRTIKRLVLDANGNVTNVVDFLPADGATDTLPIGDPVKFVQGPDGWIYYVDIGFTVEFMANPAAIRRIRYSTGNQPPVAVSSASPQSGPAPLTVDFSSVGSSDPEGAALSYFWDFGDATYSTDANPQHTYNTPGPYVVRLFVSDGNESAWAADLPISVGTPPVPTILSPADLTTFRAGDVINYSGSATDAEDGTLAASAFTWTIQFHHDSHIHPGGVFTGTTSGVLSIPTSGHDYQSNTWYEILLTVTDSSGLQASTSVGVYPEKVDISFDTVPSGLTLSIDGLNKQTPFVIDDLVGFQHTITAPNQSFSGTPYAFVSWSDAGAASHAIVVPETNQSYTATYRAMTSTVEDVYLFYAGSPKWNVTNGATFSDDNAIAPDKTAYLPGSGTATLSSVSSYAKGINAIMVDLAGSHGAITANDFIFKVGNNNSPSTWATATAPTLITTRAGAGTSGSDRVELMWADNAIPNTTWLEVIVKGNDALGGSNVNTGLASSYVFYFGSAIGETGAGNSTRFSVTSSDEADIRNHPSSVFAPTPIGSPWDINRDGPAGSSDQALVRLNSTSNLDGLIFLNVGAGGPFAPSASSSEPEFQAAFFTVVVTNAALEGDSGIGSALASILTGNGIAQGPGLPAPQAPSVVALGVEEQATDAYFGRFAEPSDAMLARAPFFDDEISVDDEDAEEAVFDMLLSSAR